MSTTEQQVREPFGQADSGKLDSLVTPRLTCAQVIAGAEALATHNHQFTAPPGLARRKVVLAAAANVAARATASVLTRRPTGTPTAGSTPA
jgi:hypothetical protein